MPAVLAQADSLIAAGNPGRAVFLLADHQGEKAQWSKAAQMRYELLRLKAQDRDYYVHRTDKVVLPLLAYYEGHADECRLDEVYYYAARVYHDMGDAPQANALYGKVLARTHDDALRRDACRRMGDLYAAQGLRREALTFYRQTAELAAALHDSLAWAHAHRDMGMLYKELGDLDAAMSHYRQAAQHPILGRRWMPMLMAEILYEQGDYRGAMRMLSPLMSGRWTPGEEFGRAYLTYGKALWKIGEPVEALSFFEKMAKDGRPEERREAYRCLITIYGEISWDKGTHEGKHIQQKRASDYMAEYFDRYVAESEALEADRQQETLQRMTALYNYNRRESENRRLEAELRQSRAQRTLAVVGFVLAAVAAGFFLWRLTKRRAQVQDLEDELRRQRLRQAGASPEVVAARRSQRQFRSALAESSAYTMVREHLSAALPMRDEDWTQVQGALAELCPDFYATLMTWRISIQELHICLLMKMELQQSEIAVLTSRTDEAISSAKRRLCRKVLGIDGSAGQWNRFIASL